MRKKVSKMGPKKTHQAKRLQISGGGKNAKNAKNTSLNKQKPSMNRPPAIDTSGALDFMIKHPRQQRDSTSDPSSLGSDTQDNQLYSATSSSDATTTVNQPSRVSVNQSRKSTRNRSRKQAKPKKRKNHITKEIRLYQGTTNMLMPKLPFSRLVREIMKEHVPHADYRITPPALGALQESAEAYLVNLFEDANFCCLHRSRITIHPKDMKLAMYIRGPTDPGHC